MKNTTCGNPKALPEQVGGFSVWPDAMWGGRVRLRPTQDTFLMFGIFQVNRHLYGNGAGFRSAWLLSGSGDMGVYVPAEVAWQPKFGCDGLPGNYKLGLLRQLKLPGLDSDFRIGVDRGFWPAWPKDTLSAMFSHQKLGNQLTNAQESDQFFRLPLVNSATGVQTGEGILEATYQIQVTEGVTFAGFSACDPAQWPTQYPECRRAGLQVTY